MNHEDGDQALLWIYPIRAAVRAAPAEATDRCHAVSPIAVDGHEPEPETEAVGTEPGSGLVGGHKVDGVGRHDTHAVEDPPLPYHLEEAGVVPCRRKQPRSPAEAPARALHIVPLAAWPIRCTDSAAGAVAGIHGGEALSLAGEEKWRRRG